MKGNAEDDPPIDASRKFCRVLRVREGGVVEFAFAIGAPELFAELILPRAAFEQFMAQPGMEPLLDVDAEDARRRHEAYLYGPEVLEAAGAH
jgi:hypothetical protein